MCRFLRLCWAGVATLAFGGAALANPPPPAVGIGRGGEIRGRTHDAPPPPAVGIGRGGEIRGSNLGGMPPPVVRIPAPPVVHVPPPPAMRACGNRPLRIPAPPVVTLSGMWIERLSSAVAFPGDTLVIHGENFGSVPGPKVVAINGDGQSHRMEVVQWTDRFIRVRVPWGPSAGGARVLIYYDDSSETSSNSKTVTVLLDRLPPR